MPYAGYDYADREEYEVALEEERQYRERQEAERLDWERSMMEEE